MWAKLLIEHRLVMDNHQNEVLVGLRVCPERSCWIA
jgi:hypothetical protein